MKIRVTCYGQNAANKLQWRDWWEREGLAQAFQKQGHEIVEQFPDLDFLLIGHPMWKNHLEQFDTRKAAFIHSHFERSLAQDWGRWEHIFIRSFVFLPDFERENPGKVSTALGFTDKSYIGSDGRFKHDLVYLGSAGGDRTETLQYLIDTRKYDIGIAGHIGEELGGDYGWYGEFIESPNTPHFYNLGKTTLYIPNTRSDAFTGVTPVDVSISSDSLCVHRRNADTERLFPNMPMWDSKEHLIDVLDYLLTHKQERSMAAADCRKRAAVCTYDNMVKQVMETLC